MVLVVGCNKNKELKRVEQNFEEIGVLNVSIDKPLEIYANPTDNKAIDKITFNKVLFGKNRGKIEVKSSLKEKLNPYIISNSSSYNQARGLVNVGLMGFYAKLKFRVISSTPEYFEILVNDETKEIGYIKKESRKVVNSSDLTHEEWEELKENYLIFTTWEEYLKQAIFVRTDNCDLYDKANGNIIDKSERNIFKVTDVQGDWLYGIPPQNYLQDEQKTSWIKWRKNGNLIVQIIMEIYE